MHIRLPKFLAEPHYIWEEEEEVEEEVVEGHKMLSGYNHS
jgi:hypothetical protein